MAVDFPSSPTTGQQYTYAGKTWEWSGSGWILVATSGLNVTIGPTAVDILTASNNEISADNAGADKLVFWDDSAGKLSHLTVGSGLSVSGTEITAALNVSDGDKGDITVSGSGAIWSIDNEVINDAKIASNAAIAGSKVQGATTTSVGVVGLTDSTSSTSTTTAATPNSVKTAYDLAAAAQPKVRAVSASATTGTITPNSDTTDLYVAEGLTGAIILASPSGTPVNGQKLLIRLKDNGTAQGITWTTSSGGFRAIGISLPTTTVLSKTTYVGCVYNSADLFWDAVATVTQS